MLELFDVTKNYEGVVGAESMRVLRGVTLKVEKGQAVAIVGPSGSGKSTLLNIIGGLDKPSSGRVLLDGTDLAGLDEDELAKMRNREVGFVFQLHHLLPQCTVLENVLVPTLVNKGVDKKKVIDRAEGLLERVGLAEYESHRPGELSVGQRQRAAVVRALINEPKLLLADEPTGSLDSVTSETIGKLLVDINRSEKVTLIVVTHSARLAEEIGGVMELKDGLLKAKGAV